jgi:hypothetical protein
MEMSLLIDSGSPVFDARTEESNDSGPLLGNVVGLAEPY